MCFGTVQQSGCRLRIAIIAGGPAQARTTLTCEGVEHVRGCRPPQTRTRQADPCKSACGSVAPGAAAATAERASQAGRGVATARALVQGRQGQLRYEVLRWRVRVVHMLQRYMRHPPGSSGSRAGQMHAGARERSAPGSAPTAVRAARARFVASSLRARPRAASEACVCLRTRPACACFRTEWAINGLPARACAPGTPSHCDLRHLEIGSRCCCSAWRPRCSRAGRATRLGPRQTAQRHPARRASLRAP